MDMWWDSNQGIENRSLMQDPSNLTNYLRNLYQMYGGGMQSVNYPISTGNATIARSPFTPDGQGAQSNARVFWKGRWVTPIELEMERQVEAMRLARQQQDQSSLLARQTAWRNYVNQRMGLANANRSAMRQQGWAPQGQAGVWGPTPRREWENRSWASKVNL